MRIVDERIIEKEIKSYGYWGGIKEEPETIREQIFQDSAEDHSEVFTELAILVVQLLILRD